MKEELKYLWEKIEELETDEAYYEQESMKSEDEAQRSSLNESWTKVSTELNLLRNILTDIKQNN